MIKRDKERHSEKRERIKEKKRKMYTKPKTKPRNTQISRANKETNNPPTTIVSEVKKTQEIKSTPIEGRLKRGKQGENKGETGLNGVERDTRWGKKESKKGNWDGEERDS